MNRKESLLWTLFQDLYPKYQKGEIDIEFLKHVWEQLFNPCASGMEEIEDDDSYSSNLDKEFNL